MNPVLILTRNNLELTKRCVESIRNQDVPTEITMWDNGSTDDTKRWLSENSISFYFYPCDYNSGVSFGWNTALSLMFQCGADHVLVLNNDTVLPPWFYRRLLAYEAPFVTGIAVDKHVDDEPPFDKEALDPHPDFSAFLIRRSAWEIVGPFDERMKIYCSDCDWHVRAHRKGLRLWKSNSPYFHINSQTLKRADPAERAAIEMQANLDREVFRELYGCTPGTKEYEELFK